jgi:hypothetical protein
LYWYSYTFLPSSFLLQVVPFTGHPNTFPAFIRKHRPRLFVHGDDWKTGVQAKARKGVQEAMEDVGGRLVEPTYTPGISSSMIHERVKRLTQNVQQLDD